MAVRKDGRSCSSNFEKCNIAPSVPSLNCAGPRAASKSLPEAPEGWTKRLRRARRRSSGEWSAIA
eukprot:15481064-Alexandrium_andersonii.AAC.1